MDESRRLTGVLDELEASLDGRDRIPVEQIQQAFGKRSFGPLLLVVGLAALTPPGLVPFGVAAPAAAITAFGLGLTARDGAMVLIALIVGAGGIGLVALAVFR